MRLQTTVNERAVDWDIHPGDLLLDVLRREGFYSVKRGCETGDCGSCTVLVDERPINACVMPAAQAQERRITTVEGIAGWNELHALQRAFIDQGAIQCGFCTPAMLLTALALLKNEPRPDERRVREALSGVLCRCTGYLKPVEAILRAAQKLSGSSQVSGPGSDAVPAQAGLLFNIPPSASSFQPSAPLGGVSTLTKPAEVVVAAPSPAALHVVGQSEPKVDGEKLARGLPAFTDDIELRGMLYAKILTSPHAHARIRRIDASKARVLPGVHAVLTYENVARVPYTTAGQSYPEPSPYDMYSLDSKVRFVGDRVAVVAAETLEIAERALKLVEVEYDLLPPVLDPELAMQAGAPVIHDEPDATGIHDVTHNVAAHVQAQMGDVERGLAEADVVLDRTYRVPQVQQVPLENHICISYLDSDDRLVLRTSTQVPFHTRRIVAQVTGLPVHRIRVYKPRIGGGFGAKQEVLIEDLCAHLTLATHRPVRLQYTREEEFRSSRSRHPQILRLRVGARRDGTLTAIDLRMISNTGAYGTHSRTVMGNTCHRVVALYRAPNLRLVGDAVYTNLPPAGAYRGYGAPQAYLALECFMDELAHELGMDPVELRRLNWVREGDPANPLAGKVGEGTVQSNVIESCGLAECTDEALAAIGWQAKRPRSQDGRYRYGLGMAVARQGSGIAGVDLAGATIKMNDDGSFNLLVGATDLGTGGDTILAQIAAGVLGVRLQDMIVYSSDTDLTPFDKGAYASSTTYVSGGAVKKAADEVRRQILLVASELLAAPPDELCLANRRVTSRQGREVTLEEIGLHTLHKKNQQQIMATASHVSDASPSPFVAQCVEVQVDVETGEVRLLRAASAVDCGQPINPLAVEGQVEGSVIQGMGYGLCEEMRFDPEGRMLNASLRDYHVLQADEMPEMKTIIVRTNEPTGPFGAKAAGEVAINGIAPAIVNAVYDAIGIRFYEIPLTPERVWRALREQERQSPGATSA